MPCDYKKYDPLWQTVIRPDILKRAGNKCETCGVQNGLVGYRDLEGKFYTFRFIMDQLDDYGIDMFDDELKHHIKKDFTATNPITIVLTVAHKDHDVTNNDYSNLIAECQRCHLKRDSMKHRVNSRKTRNKNKGLQELF